MKVGLDSNNKWIELEANSSKGLYIDATHKANLDMATNLVHKDWDMIFVYDGYEGSGKSVKAMQDAFYCDPTLTLSRIVFNPADFKKAVKESSKYQSIVFDEAYGGLSSRGSMSSVNRTIVQMLTVIREKNLFIFIVLPSFFDLDKYVAIWRSRALIHVYTADNHQRGFFKFFNKDRKKNLYIEGKKLYNYNCQKPNYMGRFTNTYVVDEEKYRTKKRETSIQESQTTSVFIRGQAAKIKATIVQNLKELDLGLTQKQIGKILGVSQMTIYKYLNDNNYEVNKELTFNNYNLNNFGEEEEDG